MCCATGGASPRDSTRMAAVSLAVHAAIVAFLVFGPGHWFSNAVETPKPIMTITIGGAGAGPQVGRPRRDRRPSRADDRTGAKARSRASAGREGSRNGGAQGRREAGESFPAPGAVQPVKAPARRSTEARGRTPTRGDEVRAGSAIAETSARGQGFGALHRWRRRLRIDDSTSPTSAVPTIWC